MFMQLATYIVILFMITLPAVATECKSELMGLTVFLASRDKEWLITWKADGVHRKEADFYGNLKEGYRTNIYDSRGNKRSENLPQTLLKGLDNRTDKTEGCGSSNVQFNVPFDISQNGDILIAAIHDNKLMIFPAKKLAIVDLKKQKIVRIIETNDKIRSLALAPDSKYFAVLYAQDVTKQVFKGPKDWLADFVGHPISYYTFYLTLYQPNGTLVCTEQIEKKVPLADGYLDWEKQ